MRSLWKLTKKYVQKYDKPALFITGRQDNSVGYQDLWNLIEDYPRATFAVLDLAGHNLQIEQPELFHCLVREWIARTEIQTDLAC